LPAEAANPAVTTNLPTTVAIAPALSTVSVQPGGTDAWVTFTSTVPSTARVEVQQAGLKNIDPVMVASGTEPAGHHPIGGVGSPVATSVGAVNASDPVAPVYETTHKLHLTNLKPGTSYHASVSASTQAGDQLSSQVRFDTLQERVRITVDTIDLQHGGALFGDNTVWWYLGVSWGGTGYQPVSAQGSVTTCFPSNDSGDPMERVVGVCQTGSYGDGTFVPLNNRQHHLSWVFAQENFDVMPTTFTVSGAADEQDFFSPGEPNPEYTGRGCLPKATTTVPVGMGAQSTTISVCGDDLNTTFQSLVTYRVEVFYDNAVYQAPGRNAPTSPWI
jgi:hypothetical protein